MLLNNEIRKVYAFIETTPVNNAGRKQVIDNWFIYCEAEIWKRNLDAKHVSDKWDNRKK